MQIPVRDKRGSSHNEQIFLLQIKKLINGFAIINEQSNLLVHPIVEKVFHPKQLARAYLYLEKPHPAYTERKVYEQTFIDISIDIKLKFEKFFYKNGNLADSVSFNRPHSIFGHSSQCLIGRLFRLCDDLVSAWHDSSTSKQALQNQGSVDAFDMSECFESFSFKP